MEQIYVEGDDSPSLCALNVSKQILQADYQSMLCGGVKLSAKKLVVLLDDLLFETLLFVQSAKLCRERDAERGCRVIPDYIFVHGLSHTETTADMQDNLLNTRKRYEEIDPVLLSASQDYESLKSRVSVILKLLNASGDEIQTENLCEK